MRSFPFPLLGGLALLALGCGGSQPITLPDSPSAQPEVAGVPEPGAYPVASVRAELGPAWEREGIASAALGIYTLTFDPDTLSGAIQLKETRTGQANSDVYLLSIDSFLNAKSFELTGVSATPTTVNLEYIFRHPFPGPSDPEGTPNGSTNRADLGISGKILFLADVPDATGNTYFTDRVANTTLIANADAYYRPGGLLGLFGTANTFPYRILVDELVGGTGSRNVSNGGSITGNFGIDGWTRDELGETGDGWTGYGVLHQGQTTTGSVALNKSALSGGFSLDVAIIAKYNDPRGGVTPDEKKANRLPPATPFAGDFAYRMPHGALDGQRVVFRGESGGFVQNQLTASTLRFHVEDWDARALTTGSANLKDDPSFVTVPAGAAGPPTLRVCIPGVLGDFTFVRTLTNGPQDNDTAFGGDSGPDSGRPGDALFYSESVTKTVFSGQTAGVFTGLVEVVDPVGTPAIPLGPNLAPVSFNPPTEVTYQVFQVTMQPINAPPTASAFLTTGSPMLSGTAPEVSVTGITEPNGNPVSILVNWGDGAGFQSMVSNLPSPYGPQLLTGPQMNNADLIQDFISVTVRVTNGVASTDYFLNYTLGPNRPPQITGNVVLLDDSLATPAIFTLGAGDSTVYDPEGDTITYWVTNNRNSNQIGIASLPANAHFTPITNPPHATVTFTVYATDPAHPQTSGTVFPTVGGTINQLPGWAWTATAATTGVENAYGIAIDGVGNAFIYGTYATSSVDFGGGPRSLIGSSPDIFLVKIDPTGNTAWDRTIGATGTNFDQPGGVVADADGNVYISGIWRGNLVIAGGPSMPSTTSYSTSYNDVFVAKISGTGSNLWQARTTGGGSVDFTEQVSGDGLALGPAGELFVCGKFHRSETFGATTLVNAAGDASLTFDPFLAKLDSAGNWVWATNWISGVSTIEAAQAVAATASGDVIVGGYANADTDFGDGIPLVTDTNGDGFLMRRSGVDGSWMWSRTFDGAANNTEWVTGVATDASQVYMVGRYYNNTNFGGILRPATSTGSDAFVAAYSLATGAWQWDRTFNGSNGSDNAWSVAVNGPNVYVVGEFLESINFGTGLEPTSAGKDAYIVRLLTASGNLDYYRILGPSTSTSAGDDILKSIAVTAQEQVFATGTFTNLDVDLDPGSGVVLRSSNGTNADPFAIRFNGSSGSF